MKVFIYIALIISVSLNLRASLAEQVKIDAFIVTKAELRRHMAGPENDGFRPSTYAELEASQGAAQPDYLVLRFLEVTPSHYFGEAEAHIDGRPYGPKVDIVLHYNKGWVEYFLPLDGGVYGVHGKTGTPQVSVVWKSLHGK